MTIRLINGAEFLHIPKTGGTWVESILEKNKLIAKRFGHKHTDYDSNLLKSTLTGQQHLKEAGRLAQSKILNLFSYSPKSSSHDSFRFCFVRHPLSWYESWWKFMKAREWEAADTPYSRRNFHPNSVLNKHGSDDFNEFVSNIIQERPGYVSELLFAYTKPDISFIGRTETIREDLVYLLDLLALPYDCKTIEKSPKMNVSKTNDKEIQWDPELKKIVIRLELPALLSFGYLSDKEKSELGIEMAIKPHQALHQSLQKSDVPPKARKSINAISDSRDRKVVEAS